MERNDYHIKESTVERFLQVESYYDKDCKFAKTAKRYLFSDFDPSNIDKQYINRKNNNIVNTETLIVKERMDYIKSRFSSIDSRNIEAYDKHAFDGSFDTFLNWWLDGVDRENGLRCYYCRSTEKDWTSIIKTRTNGNKYESGHLHKSKKGGRNADVWGKPNMEIDRINPSKGYNRNNCVFACHLCNNAKSDLIEANDFKKYFGRAINSYIQSLTNK